MWFGVLGPVLAGNEAGGVSLGSANLRVLLAVLLLDAPRPVSVERLERAIWGAEPPASRGASLRNHISRLRRLLADAAPEGDRMIEAVPGGYRLSCDERQVDWRVFDNLMREADSARRSGDWPVVAARLTEALALWRGEPLADARSEEYAVDVAGLAERRLVAIEQRVEADIRLGGATGVISELRALAAEHPLRESVHGLLMLACCLAGRQAEALEAYTAARQILIEDVGVEPGPELRELHARILGGDRSQVIAWAGWSGDERSGVPGPAQLPAGVADFTGREDSIRGLERLLRLPAGTDPREAVRVAVVCGPGGIGKTALAIEVAHRWAASFPDGQLYAELRGSGPSGVQPRAPGEILAFFLRSFDLPDSAIPADEGERAARLRSVLAGRRVLILLDDARDAAQIRPLIPGAAGCAVLVTSRTRLSDLAGAGHVELPTLPLTDAVRLFGAIVGEDRAAAEPPAVRSLLDSCGGLPLAIRIAAARLAGRPASRISALADRLADARSRLDELAVGDAAVRASFQTSYAALPVGEPGPASMFRLLGLCGTATISVPAAAALARRDVGAASAALEALVDAHLLQAQADGRYRMHDLLRIYAAELVEHIDDRAVRDAALEAMLVWYGAAVTASCAVFGPGRRQPGVLEPLAAPPFANPRQAVAWCDAERANLVAAVRMAADFGRHDLASGMAAGLWGFIMRRPDAEDWPTVHDIGLDSARRRGDESTEAWLLSSLASLYSDLGRTAECYPLLDRALILRGEIGDRTGRAAVLNMLGCVHMEGDEHEAALPPLHEALTVYQDLGQTAYTAIALHNLGKACQGAGRHDEALTYLLRALSIRREVGDRYGEGITENVLAKTYAAMGFLERAVDHFGLALAAYADTGAGPLDRAATCTLLGDALHGLGRAEEAVDAWRSALALLENLADPKAEEVRRRLLVAATRSGPGPDSLR